MTEEDEKIQDLGTSPNSPEWVPPIGAMGGPPAHELYRDLVQHADLRLLRGPNSEPWLITPRRRTSPGLPGPERGAHGRPRSVPDAPEPPTGPREGCGGLRSHRPGPRLGPRCGASGLGTPHGPWDDRPPDRGPAASSGTAPSDDPPTAAALAPAEGPFAASPWDEAVEPGPPMDVLPPVRPTTVSGEYPPRRSNNDSLPRYVKVLHEMVRNGDWLGTLDDLSNEIGEDSFTVFASLIRHRTDLAAEGIVVAPVEVEDGWRWLAVDRGRTHDGKPE